MLESYREDLVDRHFHFVLYSNRLLIQLDRFPIVKEHQLERKTTIFNRIFHRSFVHLLNTTFSWVRTSRVNFSLWYCSRNSVTSVFNCEILFSRFSITLMHRSFSFTWRSLSFCKSSFSSLRISRCRWRSVFDWCKRSQSKRIESICVLSV